MSLSRTRRDRDAASAPPVQINVVPLVDVSLVLLVIFLVTATFIKTSALRLELPQDAGVPAPAPRERVIDVDRNGAFAWNGVAVSDAGLADALRQAARAHGTAGRVTVRGDTRAGLGRVVRAMAMAQAAGFGHLSVATARPAPPDGRAPGGP